jgi:hypothetical protein
MSTAISYVTFLLIERPEGRKTDIWHVGPKEGEGWNLGEVKFHGAWRKYCFFPFENTLFDHACLRAIADFCEQKTAEWRKKCLSES